MQRGLQHCSQHHCKRIDIPEQESAIKTVNVNLISFKSNHSTIIAKLKASSKQVTMMVPYKVNTGCDDNIMPFNVFKKLFPSTVEY